MAERPILCAAPVVRAILQGRQVQDRRPVKPAPPDGHTLHTCWHQSWKKEKGRVHASWEYWTGPVFDARPEGRLCGLHVAVAPWSFGDVLYVRETWRTLEQDDGTDGIFYPADGSFRPIDNTPEAADLWGMAHANGKHGKKYRPSLHMPKWAARLHLRVLSVRVERVNAISEEDAAKEGVADVAAFRALWDSLYGEGSFDAGTWCWVTDFEVAPHA